MANVLAEIAKKLQASGKRYTPRDLGAIGRLVGYLGEDGETEMSDKKFRILNQSIADNEAYDWDNGRMYWPSRIELEGLPPEDIKVRVDDFDKETGKVDNNSYAHDYLANFGSNLNNYLDFSNRDVKVTPYYGPFRDMYMTMSPDEQLEVAAPLIADEMAKDYENRGIKLAVEDPDAWMANEREKDLEHCGERWKQPKKIKECLDEKELGNLRWLKNLQDQDETFKKNIAEFRVTPEDVMLDPLQYTESFRPDVRKLANKLLTGED